MAKVRLSNIDRGIEIFTAVNSYKNRKTNQKVLEQQKKNNKHLSDLKREMYEANSINRKVLQNQLKAEEHKEEQKFYKALSFNLNEIVGHISKIDDELLLCYVLENYYEKIKSDLIEANDKLDEIHDKTYNRLILEKLKSAKERAANRMDGFKDSLLSRIDSLIEDLKVEEAKISQKPKPKAAPKIKDKPKSNTRRILGIVVLGFFTSAAIAPLFITGLIIFGVPFAYLLYREIKWQRGYEDYLNNQNMKRQAIIDSDLQHQETIAKEKEDLLNHPLYEAMEEVNEKHPSFYKTLSVITELEEEFENKWM